MRTAPPDSPGRGAPDRRAEIDHLFDRLTAIRQRMWAFAGANADTLHGILPCWRESGQNLLHYLSLRQHDHRPLQEELAAFGLSSLGRSECEVLAAVDAVLAVLARLNGREPQPADSDRPRTRGQDLLDVHTDALFGDPPASRAVRIMVTMPGEAGHDYPLVRDLLAAGMDCMRVNCAHDEPDVWERMIAHLRRAEQEIGRRCRVLMDLGGPKVRTGPLPPGPKVVKVRPTRDDHGRVTAPARVWLTATPAADVPPEATAIIVSADWLARLRLNDRVRFSDARGARREWVVEASTPAGCLVRSSKTCYVTTDTVLSVATDDGERAPRGRTHIADLPPREQKMSLAVGDRLAVVRGERVGRLAPPEIGCTLPQVFDRVAAGHPIWFDDGRIGGVVREVTADRFVVEITACPPGSNLGAGKGINLPETDLNLPPLTDEDIEHLRFVAVHADLVGYSFVQSADGVRELQRRLAEAGRGGMGIVLKIETRQGFARLPELLLAAMRSPAIGVMIARGDLAVECGFERLAEVQEEILWICEAAHVPVVWATQVLEGLAKTGRPSRAEITDAAMGERAECVMLNKGPHVLDAVRTLDNILRRMQEHTRKKRAMLRPLRVASGLFAATARTGGHETATGAEPDSLAPR